MEVKRRNLPVVVRRAPDKAGVWIAHCLEGDILTEGDSPLEAIMDLPEAVMIVVEDMGAAGRDPWEIFETKAPSGEFELYHRITAEGEPIVFTELDLRKVDVLVTQLHLVIAKQQVGTRATPPPPPTVRSAPGGWAGDAACV